MSDVKVRVSADGTQFERGIGQIKSSLSGLKHFAAEAFGVLAVERLFHKTIESAEELVNSSKRLGIPIEKLQVLRQAAEESAVDFGKLQSAMERIDLARNTEKGIAALKQMGLTAEDIKNKGASELFMGGISEYVRANNPENIASEMKTIFGKSFGQVGNVLRTNFEELQRHMEDIGAIMDAQTAASIKVLKDDLFLLARVILVKVAPAVLYLMETFERFFAWIHKIANRLGVRQAMEEDNPQLKTLRDEYKRLGFSVLKDEANKFLPSAAFTDYQAKQDAAKARMKAIEKEIADIESPYEQLIKELNEGVDKQRASLKEQIEKLTADMEHPPKLNLAVKPQGYKSILGLENEGGSMVKIGGLLGTDSAYRMERLAQRQVDLLQGIKNILEKGQTVQEGETDMSYNDSY